MCRGGLYLLQDWQVKLENGFDVWPNCKMLPSLLFARVRTAFYKASGLHLLLLAQRYWVARFCTVQKIHKSANAVLSLERLPFHSILCIVILGCSASLRKFVNGLLSLQLSWPNISRRNPIVWQPIPTVYNSLEKHLAQPTVRAQVYSQPGHCVCARMTKHAAPEEA